jgi:ferrous iron transport protein B
VSAPRPLIAIAGNPNAGKTTLFNVLTGSRARVGNYPGVTVEKRVGETSLPGRGTAEVLDIPGTYSLVARTGEEQIALAAIAGVDGERAPDAVVVCVDATSLVRGLYLVLQVLELGVPVVVALTMMDEAGESAPDPEKLARKLGCPVVPVVAPKGRGLVALQQRVADCLGGERTPRWHWKPSPALAVRMARVRAALPEAWPASDALALWALMSLDTEDELAHIPPGLRAEALCDLEEGRRIDDEAIAARYAWLDREVAPLVARAPDRSRTERVDRILIHPVAGLAMFLGIMFAVFQALFAWAEPVIKLIEALFGHLGHAATRALPPGLLADFVANGVIAGVGAVVVFLPQILLLFLFLGLLEDSGYMARVAYLVDRIMRAMNLHGRAFVPILSGFACAVPAIMATRTMERKRDRLLTMLVVPLTTCSARLPVYTLVIASLFPARRVWGLFPVQGLLMVFMYAFGIVAALVAAAVLSRAVKSLQARRLPFVIELPPYRMPRGRDVLHMMWERSRSFLTEAGRVIFAGSVVLWALLTFPRPPAPPPAQGQRVEIAIAAPDDVAERTAGKERLEHSFAGQLGRTIEPVLSPLGFDWKIGIGIIGAFAAREVFVSTMGVVYGVGANVDEQTVSLRDKLRAERRPDGRPVYTPLVGLTLMIFFALSCQCMSTLAVVRRETGTLRWPLFLFGYMTVLAWVVSAGVYQGGRLLGFE